MTPPGNVFPNKFQFERYRVRIPVFVEGIGYLFAVGLMNHVQKIIFDGGV